MFPSSIWSLGIQKVTIFSACLYGLWVCEMSPCSRGSSACTPQIMATTYIKMCSCSCCSMRKTIISLVSSGCRHCGWGSGRFPDLMSAFSGPDDSESHTCWAWFFTLVHESPCPFQRELKHLRGFMSSLHFLHNNLPWFSSSHWGKDNTGSPKWSSSVIVLWLNLKIINSWQKWHLIKESLVIYCMLHWFSSPALGY